MKKSVLRKYATLIATVGVNVQKGQEVFIAAELDQPEFVRWSLRNATAPVQSALWWTGTISR